MKALQTNAPSLRLFIDHQNTSKSCIHFIGIGGIGMSGLALTLKHYGYNIQGSDHKDSKMLHHLNQKGIQTFSHHHPTHLNKAVVVVISSAISMDNPELQAACEKGLPILKRGDVLGMLTPQRKTISIAGSHGKTTTTSLIATLLDQSDLHPLVLSGGVIQSYQSNVILGDGEFLVAEMDESDGSHQRASSYFGIITNIDPEHMDFYKSEKHLLDSFHTFLQNIHPGGKAILCTDHPTVEEISKSTQTAVLTYGFKGDPHIHLKNFKTHANGITFSARMPNGRTFEDLNLRLYGQHNALNAAAALGVAWQLGLGEEKIRQTFQNFQGVARRFQETGRFDRARVIDDYAHHPIEITAVLNAARHATRGRIYAVCEPHRYTRLKDHLKGFAEALSLADKAFVMPLYSASETPIEGISSDTLVDCLKDCGVSAEVTLSIEHLKNILSGTVNADDVILFMGAGQSTEWAHKLPMLCIKT